MEPIAAILSRKRHDREKLILISFDKAVVKACRETLPEYRSCLVSSLKGFAGNGAPERYLADLAVCGSQGLIFKERTPVTKAWLAQARGDHGILMAWTVNTRESALRATRLGSMFLATDRPGALRDELAPAVPISP